MIRNDPCSFSVQSIGHTPSNTPSAKLYQLLLKKSLTSQEVESLPDLIDQSEHLINGTLDDQLTYHEPIKNQDYVRVYLERLIKLNVSKEIILSFIQKFVKDCNALFKSAVIPKQLQKLDFRLRQSLVNRRS